jgi:hypothetical protein
MGIASSIALLLLVYLVSTPSGGGKPDERQPVAAKASSSPDVAEDSEDEDETPAPRGRVDGSANRRRQNPRPRQEPRSTSYEIRLSPATAKLSLRGEGARLTERAGRTRLEVDDADGSRTVIVTASHPGYQNVERTLTPGSGEEDVLNLELTPLAARYSLKIDPPAALLEIREGSASAARLEDHDDHVQIVGEGAEREVIIPNPLRTAKLVLKLSHAGHGPFQRELNPVPGGHENLILRLAPELFEPPPGHRKVAGVPWGVISGRDKDSVSLVVYTGSFVDLLEVPRTRKYAGPPPGAIWFISRGGRTWRGKILGAGGIYRINEAHDPELMPEGTYSVWGHFDQDQRVYREEDERGPELVTIPAKKRVRLLMVADGSKGKHRSDGGVRKLMSVGPAAMSGISRSSSTRFLGSGPMVVP